MNEIFRMTFLIELSVIAVTDIREKKISNRSVIFLCLTAAGFVLLYRKTDVMSHLLGAVCVSVPLLVTAIVVPGAFGMGDVKFMAAGGLFLGWERTVLSVIIACAACSLYILIVWIFQTIYQKRITGKGIGRKVLHRKTELAFGAFLAVGMAVSLLWGEQLINWYQNSPFY